jgi:hypothetical protein
MDAPPSTVREPPLPIPVDATVFEISMGTVVLNLLDSNDISEIDTSGFVPSPIINLFAVKLDFPVPPYGIFIVFALQLPTLILPISVTCVKLLFTLKVVPVLVNPVPAKISDDVKLLST